MSVPNLIPYKSLYISDYICSCYAFVFIFDFLKLISKHILQFPTLMIVYNSPIGLVYNKHKRRSYILIILKSRNLPDF